MREFIKRKGHHNDVLIHDLYIHMLFAKMFLNYTDYEDMYAYAVDAFLDEDVRDVEVLAFLYIY